MEDQMRMLVNLGRSTMFLGLAALIGYYNYELNGGIGIATNICFMFLGVLLVSAWKRPEHVCPECPEYEVVSKLDEEIVEEPVDN
jgi:hypothetical protein